MSLEHSDLVGAGVSKKAATAAARLNVTPGQVLQLILKYGPVALHILEEISKVQGVKG